ncbi:MAG TPA: helix-hairpin-helix domain-containing protein [Planctomycetota bacterium]|nr:helix-hairpin-helix domain-containing protein [Planctomycetota bacterium]HUW33447.1 helix-hairpin-helix domain-containing protein [Planctomycetota bacterium]
MLQQTATLQKFDLNTASHDDLTQIPGIDEMVAGGIIYLRDEYGDFRSADDVRAVPGIDDDLLEMIKQYTFV